MKLKLIVTGLILMVVNAAAKANEKYNDPVGNHQRWAI